MCVKVNNLFACGVRVKPIFGTAFHKKGLLVLVNMSSHSLALSNTGGRQKTRSACPPAAAGYRIGFIHGSRGFFILNFTKIAFH